MPVVYLLRRNTASVEKTRTTLEEADWQLGGCSESLQDALAEIAVRMPDIVACDLRLNDGHAMLVAHELGQLPVRPQLLLLSPNVNDLQLFAALCAGANAYHVDVGTGLTDALTALHQRRANLSPLMARQALAAFGAERSPVALASQMAAAKDQSAAGRQIDQAARHLLSLLSHGLLTSEVAQAWQLTQVDVEQRIWRIVRLLHVRSRELQIV